MLESYRLLPSEPGIYLFLDKKGEILYVGKAKNLKKRVASYFTNKKNLLEKTRLLISTSSFIKIVAVESDIDALLLEANYIKKFKPKYNVKLRDAKAYPLIRITVKDEFPKVLIARRENDEKSIYFGPYPASGSVRLVLKLIRRIFPFESVENHPKKPCLYYHLGLCPCVSVFNSDENKKEYKKNIRHIIEFLKDGRKKIVRDLERERKNFAEKEDFEKASQIQKRLEAINYITAKNRSPFEYEENPNLVSDVRNKKLEDLKNTLDKAGVLNGNLKKLERIECFDISNTMGRQSVGSMVVFVNGEKANSFYRKFKIDPALKGPDDFLMMENVLTRRLSHKEWQYPNLIIVDGGKGQVTSAIKAGKKYDLDIPIIGLAKREEIIITSDLREIKLPKNSPSLHLVQELRDEAHRFAIAYHRKLRSKAMF